MRANRTEYLFSVNTHTPPTMTVDSGEEFTIEVRGAFDDKNDMIYVADSQTEDKEGCTPDPGCRRGIRIGSARDGTVKYFIPRPNPKEDTSGGEGVAADMAGNVFGAENVGKGLRKYAK